MKRWAGYAAAGLLVTVVAALTIRLVVGAAEWPGVWFSAGLAYVVQLIAFGALLAVRDRPELFMVGWLGGILLRFVVVGMVALWLSRTRLLPLEATLLSLVAFVVLLLFLEPVFLRRGRA